jgi:site-specific DNA-methyltransferase (adenine-specific)
MLLPARTDSAWYHDIVKPHAFHVEFLRGRVKFSGAKAGAPFPSMVVVFEAHEP